MKLRNHLKNFLHLSHLKSKQYSILIFGLFLISFFLRFYHFNQRWGFHYDPARDALVGLQAIRTGKIPLNGPFTSAGPFVFGPFLYYLIMASFLLIPKVMVAPQIILALLNAIFPLIMLKIGQVAYSKRTGLIMGLLSAFSFINIERSLILHPHNYISFFAALTLLFFIQFIQQKKLKYLFYLGLSSGSALSLHYQALNLFWFIPLVIFYGNNKLKNLINKITFFTAGFLLPTLPLLIWDFQLGWNNIGNILDYFLIGQYRIWVSNRWLTYLGKFWPEFWSNVLGALPIFGYLFFYLFISLSFYQFLRKRISKLTLLTFFVFIGQIILLRYYRAEKNPMYLMYLVPMIIFFSGFVIDRLLSINRFIGLIFMSLLMINVMYNDFSLLTVPSNSYPVIHRLTNLIRRQMPQEKFRLYVFENSEPAIGTMTSLVLTFNNLIDEKNGTKLGFSTKNLGYKPIAFITEIGPPVFVYKLNTGSSSAQINNILRTKDENWFEVSPSYLYKDIVEWWKVKKLKSYFSLIKYFQAKLFGKTF